MHPSRAAILTGQYSNKNQVYTLDDALDPNRANIAKDLQHAGYQTAVFGKWHLKKKPSGFDDFKVLPGHGVYHNPTYLSKDNWNDNEEAGTPYKGYVDDITTQLSLDWLSQRSPDKPFFLMCHYKATHEPFDFADRFKDLYQGIEFPILQLFWILVQRQPDDLLKASRSKSSATVTNKHPQAPSGPPTPISPSPPKA
nr:sulfatase-like hydrolase/transferase [Sphingobacterium sp. E70]